MKSAYSINGVSIKRPHEFKIDRYRITKAERVTSGKMVMENIARKRKFFLTWEAITATDLNKILDIIWETDACFFEFTYVESNTVKKARCYVGSIPSTLYRTDPGDWVWKDVSMNFIEQ